jgi:hypothetical protein
LTWYGILVDHDYVAVFALRSMTLAHGIVIWPGRLVRLPNAAAPVNKSGRRKIRAWMWSTLRQASQAAD